MQPMKIKQKVPEDKKYCLLIARNNNKKKDYYFKKVKLFNEVLKLLMKAQSNRFIC